MRINHLKGTLAGVKCEKTRAMVKELRRRGFQIGLEDGGSGTFKIVTLINGYYFAISMASSVYCKYYSKTKHTWQKFTDIDEIVRASCLKEKTSPSTKQLTFISVLANQIGIGDYKNPETVGEAIEMIEQLKELRRKQRYNIRESDPQKPGLSSYRKSTLNNTNQELQAMVNDDVKMVRTR